MSDQERLAAAYESCESLARSHYENFPVASLLLPKAMRPHVAAVYAFARVADDVADEGDAPEGERQASLALWIESLRAAVRAVGTELAGPLPQSKQANATDQPAVLLATANTIRACNLPIALFEDLVSAFRQDTVKKRYETFDELLDYCRRSANPVGRLVLRIAGRVDERADQASDCVCTALQLTNFWQDLEGDWERGRLYVPLDELKAEGADIEDLNRKVVTQAWRRVLTSLAGRTRTLFNDGRNVADFVDGRLAFELRLTWLGGLRILDRIEQQQFDVFRSRPTLGKHDIASLLWRAIRWSRPGARARGGPRQS